MFAVFSQQDSHYEKAPCKEESLKTFLVLMPFLDYFQSQNYLIKEIVIKLNEIFDLATIRYIIVHA